MFIVAKLRLNTKHNSINCLKILFFLVRKKVRYDFTLTLIFVTLEDGAIRDN